MKDYEASALFEGHSEKPRVVCTWKTMAVDRAGAASKELISSFNYLKLNMGIVAKSDLRLDALNYFFLSINKSGIQLILAQ